MEVVENWLYPLPDPPKRIREKPMQVLALGMSRSGTDSLCRALTILGYDHVYHGFDIVEPGRMTWGAWTKLGRRKFGTSGSNDTNSGIGRDDFDAIIGHCEAVTDQPCALFAPELIEAYPEAKVILNYRDTDAWFQSCCNSFFPLRSRFRSLVLTWFNTELYWNFRYAKDCFRPYFHDSFIHHAKWVYEEHSAKIRGLAPPDRFLEWKIGDGWEPLCR